MKWGIAAAALVLGLVIFLLSGNEGVENTTESSANSFAPERTFPISDDEEANDPFTKPGESTDSSSNTKKDLNINKEDKLAKIDEEEVNNVPLTEEEMEELEEYFEKIEDEWGQTLEQLFKQELQLPKEIIGQYEDLREGFEEEKLAAFQEYHEQMVAKHGDNYAYRPSEDEKIFEKKVLDEYYDRLRKILGDEAYARYTEVRERFNERIKAEQDPAKGILVIDF